VYYVETDDDISLVLNEKASHRFSEDSPILVLDEVYKIANVHVDSKEGALGFDESGIVFSISNAIQTGTEEARYGIPLFYISSFTTDYILIRDENWQTAKDALVKKSFALIEN